MTDTVTETETDPGITGTHTEIHTPGERGTMGKLGILRAPGTEIETMVGIEKKTTGTGTDREQGAEAPTETVIELETDTEIQGVGNQSH